MADQIRSGDPALTLDRVPCVFALDNGNGVVLSWVLALPSGDAVVIDLDGKATAYTTLDRIRARWVARGISRLVEVTRLADNAEAA